MRNLHFQLAYRCKNSGVNSHWHTHMQNADSVIEISISLTWLVFEFLFIKYY